MQKKLIALAIAGLASTGAFAQTNVTIYGIADAAYVNASGEGTTGRSTDFSGIQGGLLSGSRLGFKGSEDLGGGLSAVFVLEYALNNDINAGVGSGGALAARQQYVALNSTSWGQLGLGRQYAAGFGAAATNAQTAGLFDIQSILSVNAGMSITPNSAARISDSVNWISPKWGGFSVNAIYGFGEATAEGTSTSDSTFMGIGANYSNGPLNVDLVYHDRSNVGGVNNADIDEWYLGGKYNFGVATVFGTWQTMDIDATNVDVDVWTIGAFMPVFKSGTIGLTYGDQDVSGAGSNTDAKAWNLTYTHSLSKRTTMYAGYTDVSNDKGGFKNRVGGLSVNLAGGTGLSQDNSAFFAGMRHSF
jgi:predicted porin